MVALPKDLEPLLARIAPALTRISGRVPGLPYEHFRFGESGTGIFLQLDLHSPALEPSVRERLIAALSLHADAHGVVHFCETAYRSHFRNNEAVFNQLAQFLRCTVPDLLL